MEAQQIQTLTANFEGHAQRTENGIEYWLARDLQHLLGYGKWDNFQSVLSKARTACEVSGRAIADHFADVGKMVDLGSGSQREIDDGMLTRYACYLIAQNGDPRKPEIAFAQTYFAMQTRRAELIEWRLLETERVQARRKLSDTEKELSGVIFEQTGGNQNFALIRSKGDHALFGKSTQAMKAQWNVPDRLWAAKAAGKGHPRFVAYVLGSDQGRAALSELAAGSSGRMKNIGKTDVLALKISAPVLAEQQRIADCLASLDTRITAETHQLAALKTHKQGLMQQLLPALEAVA